MPDEWLSTDLLQAGTGISHSVKTFNSSDLDISSDSANSGISATPPIEKRFFGSLVLSVLLMAFGTDSPAASLGRMSGPSIIGRPLDVSLSARLAATESLSAICVNADVFFGDSELTSSTVRTTISPGASAGEALIRVRTASLVNEPVVTLYVHEGCHQKSTRKYVLLPEMPEDGSPAAPFVPAQSMVVQVPGVPGVHADAGHAGHATPSLSGKAFRAKPRFRLSTRDTAHRGSAAKATARAAFKAAPDLARESRARLKLEPIDLGTPLDPVLRYSPELLSRPSADAQQRATVAALWQVLNAQPQDVARDSQRLKSLEADVAGMLAQSRKTELAVTELRSQLERARHERYSNWLVYALYGALLLALLALFFFWVHGGLNARRLSRGPWWGGYSGDHLAMDGVFEADQRSLDRDRLRVESLTQLPTPQLSGSYEPSGPSTEAMPAEPAGEAKFADDLNDPDSVSQMTHVEELDVEQQADFFLLLSHPDNATDPHPILDLDLTQVRPVEGVEGPEFARLDSHGGMPRRVDAGKFDNEEQVDISPSADDAGEAESVTHAGSAGAPDGPAVVCNLDGRGMPRLVTVEELDVQQRAHLFLLQGQVDKAVDALCLHLMNNAEPSMLVYQELFDLYYSLGRKDDYDALRKDFWRVFDILAPAFGNYAAATHGREFYAAALAQTESLWPKLPHA